MLLVWVCPAAGRVEGAFGFQQSALTVHALARRYAGGDGIQINRLPVAGKRMGALVADVGKGRGDGTGQLPLDAQIPCIHGGQKLGIPADFGTHAIRDRDLAVGGNRGKDKGRRTNGEIESGGIRARVGQVLIGKHREVLGHHMTEERSEDANVKASSIARANAPFSDRAGRQCRRAEQDF